METYDTKLKIVLRHLVALIFCIFGLPDCTDETVVGSLTKLDPCHCLWSLKRRQFAGVFSLM